MFSKGSLRCWGLALLAACVGLIFAAQVWEQGLISTGWKGLKSGPWRGPQQGEVAFMSEGDLFQTEGCPYVISEEEADRVRQDDSKNGNTISLNYHGGGRAGNHYMTLSAYLAMGYCCRSRLLSLPIGDSALPHEGEKFLPGPRWFDFSDVNLPWAAFQGLGDDPEVCRPETSDGGDVAFGYEDVHWHLLQCMNRVYLRGCEKLYLGEVVNTEAFCPKRPSRRKSGGSLVIHIRSGDIFDPEGEGSRRNGFGQPPLQYYLRVLATKEWDDVTILTATWKDSSLNPTFNTLEMMADAGTLGQNVRVFKNRSLMEDVREMLCADALATSRSSLSFLTFPHTRAKVFFVPTKCGAGRYRRMKNPPVKASFDNTTLLMLEKPNAEVYGVEWRDDGSDYSVYQGWHDTKEQLLEMTTYQGIKRLEKCSVSS